MHDAGHDGFTNTFHKAQSESERGRKSEKVRKGKEDEEARKRRQDGGGDGWMEQPTGWEGWESRKSAKGTEQRNEEVERRKVGREDGGI